MKKTLFFIFISMVLAIAACQPVYKQQEAKSGQPAAVTSPNAAAADTTGNTAVDSVAKDLNSAATDEKDLGADNLTGIDSGLSDIQNI